MSDVAARQTRALPIPEGFEGQRIDQVVSRLLGLSRTVAAELVAAGDVTIDGAPCADQVRAGERRGLDRSGAPAAAGGRAGAAPPSPSRAST